MRALITGITGQDGSYLAELLLSKDYEVVGVYRRSSTTNFNRLEHIKNHKYLKLVEGEVSDRASVYSLVKTYNPHEIYNLAAQSHVGTSFNQPEYSIKVNGLGPFYFLEAIYQSKRVIKFYQASTSELFGNNCTKISGEKVWQDESTPFAPRSPYAIGKLTAHEFVRTYREAFNLHVSCGILFNHESERRGENFVTRKITKWLAEYKNWLNQEFLTIKPLTTPDGKDFNNWIEGDGIATKGPKMFPKLRLGNINTFRDWGHAEDYVKAMWLMLQQKEPDDYVIATGETHTVEDFLVEAFKVAGIDDARKYVVIDEKLFRPTEVNYLCGNATKAKEVLGWEPTISFKELVKRMVINEGNMGN